MDKDCNCSKREGKRQCIWWLSGCINPNAPLPKPDMALCLSQVAMTPQVSR